MITPDVLIWIVAGLLAVGLLLTMFGRPKGWPPADPVVRARVLDTPQPVTDPAQLLGQFHQMVDAQARALRYSRDCTAMVEAQAKAVATPWANATPPPPDPPKA